MMPDLDSKLLPDLLVFLWRASSITEACSPAPHGPDQRNCTRPEARRRARRTTVETQHPKPADSRRRGARYLSARGSKRCLTTSTSRFRNPTIETQSCSGSARSKRSWPHAYLRCWKSAAQSTEWLQFTVTSGSCIALIKSCRKDAWTRPLFLTPLALILCRARLSSKTSSFCWRPRRRSQRKVQTSRPLASVSRY